MKALTRKLTVYTLMILTGWYADATAAEQGPPPGFYQNPLQVDPADYLDKIKLPPGFSISIYASGLTAPRSMALSKNGTLYVGTLGQFGAPPVGKVYAVRDSNGDHKADEIITIASGLNYPNGVALRDGDLYVAEVGRILRYDDIDANLHHPPAPVVVTDDYPKEYHHGWKFIRFGPDGKLYVPVGAPCNVCVPDANHGVITRINPDGTGKEVVARGIRNSVGFDWNPQTGVLWFTDNGRDVMGHNIPPEELNRAPVPGLDFGYPYRYGKDLVDPMFKTDRPASDFTPAALEIPAHRAPLGIQFYTGNSFPRKYRNQLFIAQHGSWNRNPPDGYRVSVATIRDGKVVSFEDFATGWLINGRFWGRPVDLEIMHDGSLLISDDYANVIYRISYEK